MNELLQKYGCSNVFTVPEGLKELMADITREVLREQPPKIFDFIANYLSALLITREHGVMAVKILDDLCDCKPTVSEHLLQIGLDAKDAEMLASVIKEQVEGFELVEGNEKIREIQILKNILTRKALDEDMTAKVCQVVRNAYRDYWYRKKMMEKSIKTSLDEPWEIAAQHTLEIYKRTKPSFSELTRATQKIQAAYRGYHVRRNLLRHLKPKKKTGPKKELPGPPLDVAASREIDLGPVIDIKVKEDNVNAMFEEDASKKLGLQYNSMRTITHVIDDEFLADRMRSKSGIESKAALSKSLASRSQMQKESSQIEDEMDSQVEIPESAMNIAPRQSHVPEASQRQSRIPSLSFAKVPPEVIEIEDKEDEDVIPEELKPFSEGSEFEAVEASDVTPITEGETQDISEEITEYTDGEESVPATSVVSSAPETDLEDTVGEITSGEEENN